MLPKFEVILTSRSQVWTREAHFSTKLAIFESIMTSQRRSEFEFDKFSSNIDYFYVADHFARIYSDSDR